MPVAPRIVNDVSQGFQKGYLRNVRCIKGGLLRKGGCLANADIGPKKQHFH